MGVGCATRARGAVGSAQFYDLDSIRVQNETKTAQNINGNASAETPQNTPNHSTRAIKTGQRGAGVAGGGLCRIWEGFAKKSVFRTPCRLALPPELYQQLPWRKTCTIATGTAVPKVARLAIADRYASAKLRFSVYRILKNKFARTQQQELLNCRVGEYSEVDGCTIIF